MTELDKFISKLIPALEKEIGSERTFELLFSLYPPDNDPQEEFREIRERHSLTEIAVKKRFERVSPLDLLFKERDFDSASITSPYISSGIRLRSRSGL